MYVNDLAMVSNAFWSVLFADDTSLFISGKDAESMCVTINNDLSKIQKWLYCNKLSLNVLKTHYMIFTARNKTSTDLDIKNKWSMYRKGLWNQIPGCTCWFPTYMETTYRLYM